VAVEPDARAYTLTGADGLRAARWHDLGAVPRAPLRTAFVSRFATAVARGEQPDVTLDDALAVQSFIEAAYVSAAQGGVPVRPRDLLEAATASLAAGAPA
jgi:predicted dehydrogenase